MWKAFQVITVSFVIGLAFGIYFYFTYDHHISRIITSIVSSTVIGSIMMPAIYFRHYFIEMAGSPNYKIVIMLVLLIVAALIGSELTFFFNRLYDGRQYVMLQGKDVYILNIIIVLVVGIPIYVNEETKELTNLRVLNQQFRLLQLEQQHTIFELELLRAKINPHFLYNVHNSIAGLISKDPEKAEKMVLLLSKFFRFTLSKSSATYHSITDEIDIIKTYLELQSIRYEERLDYHIYAEDHVINLQMPSFILQPLVENAIKHGIEKISGKGSVTVTITQSKAMVRILVADSGADFSLLPGGGTGLQMVKNKLRLLYKDNFQMNFSNAPQKHVEIIFPEGD